MYITFAFLYAPLVSRAALEGVRIIAQDRQKVEWDRITLVVASLFMGIALLFKWTNLDETYLA